MFEIRHLIDCDFEEHYALTCYAFQAKPTPEQRERARAGFEPKTWLAAIHNDRVSSQMQIFDLEMYVAGNLVRVGGIGGVSTWPETRRQGMVAALITRALAHMKEKGQLLSALAPFSFGFYRKYGWELYVEHRQYRLAVDQLPRREHVPGDVRRVSPLAHLAEIDTLYTSFAKRYNGMLKRTNQWWEKRVMLSDSHHFVIYYTADGTAAGYLRYQIQDRVFQVSEFIYEDVQAYRALWCYISQHDSMLDAVTFIAPIDHPLPYLLAEPRIEQQTIPYFMARIVDLVAFIEQYTFVAHEQKAQTRLLLVVDDPHASWNQGSWMLTIAQDGHAKLHAVDATANDDTPDEASLHCNINDLTAMLLGHISPSTLQMYGRIDSRGGAADKLGACIPLHCTYLLDFF